MRERLVRSRSNLMACQLAMTAWRAALRHSSRQRVAALKATLPTTGDTNQNDHAIKTDTLDGTCGTKGGSLPPHHDGYLLWLELMHQLHQAARGAAEGTILIEDARNQGAALSSAMEALRDAGDELQAEKSELLNAAQDENERRSRKFSLLEEQLLHALNEQATLRGKLKKTREYIAYDEEAVLLSEQRSSHLEDEVADACRICAELMDDRSQQMADLEAQAREHQAEVLRLEEALEQQTAVVRMQQAEMRQYEHQFRLPAESPIAPREPPSWCMSQSCGEREAQCRTGQGQTNLADRAGSAMINSPGPELLPARSALMATSGIGLVDLVEAAETSVVARAANSVFRTQGAV